MEVSNMLSNKGNAIPNQFEIITKEGIYFKSYSSIIVFKPIGEGKIQLGRDWDYSVTTGRYRNIFLGEDKKETERKLKEGIYEYNENL